MSVEGSVESRRSIRLAELEQVLDFVKPGSRVLEIGAGAGWQAQKMQQRGIEVIAIDVPQSNYNELRVWPVIPYDGKRIPLVSESFDVVFSSNTLEHIEHIDEFQQEMLRVLKAGGYGIHVMPTPTWRLWSALSFYFDRVKKVAVFLQNIRRASSGQLPFASQKAPKQVAQNDRRSLRVKLLQRLFPVRHGVRGNVISELYYFSTRYWLSVFRVAGWEIEHVVPNHLFYTGHRVLGSRLDIRLRRACSRILGSSCMVYVIRKPNNNQLVS